MMRHKYPNACFSPLQNEIQFSVLGGNAPNIHILSYVDEMESILTFMMRRLENVNLIFFYYFQGNFLMV